MKKLEIWEYGKYEIISSDKSSKIIIKIDLTNSNINEVSNGLKEILKDDYLNKPGIYFIRLTKGFYIGQTDNLKRRFIEHTKDKAISNITFATYKSPLDRMSNDEIRDLESLLISYATDCGLKINDSLTNKKRESRRRLKVLEAKNNQEVAREIWNKFAQLNIDDLLNEKNSYSIDDDIEEETSLISETNGIPNKVKTNISVSTTKNKNSKEDREFVNSLLNKIMINDVNTNHKIFNFVPLLLTLPQGYIKIKRELFKKELSKKALKLYLFFGLGGTQVDAELTNNIRKKGWLTSITLAYLRIQTNGKARGSLKELAKEKATKLINDFVDENY